MSKPPKERVGKEKKPGLSIIIEGSDNEYIQKVVKELQRQLSQQNKKLKNDKDFENNDEQILSETLSLLDAVKAPLSPKSRSLLSIVSAQKRLEMLAEAKKCGFYCITTKSWLGEVVEHLKKGRGELAGQIAFDCQNIRPDVWVVLASDQKELYARTAAQCGVTVIQSSLKPTEVVKQILALTQYPLQKTQTRENKTEKTSDWPKLESQIPSKKLSNVALIYSRATSPGMYRQTIEAKEIKFITPELNSKVLKGYTLLQNKLVENFTEATKVITDYIKKHNLKEFTSNITRNIKPVSVLHSVIEQGTLSETHMLDTVVRRLEMETGAIPDTVISMVPQLVAISPHNEFDLLPYADFNIADNSLDTIRQTASLIPYEQKARRFTDMTLNSESRRNLLRHANYTFNIVLPFYLLGELQELMPQSEQIIQTLSPRIGYDIPEIVDKAGLGDLFQQSFDLSLELHSLLQSSDQIAESIYACLGGHRVRAIINLSALDLQKEFQEASIEFKNFYNDLVSTIATVHPMIALQLQGKPKVSKRKK